MHPVFVCICGTFGPVVFLKPLFVHEKKPPKLIIFCCKKSMKSRETPTGFVDLGVSLNGGTLKTTQNDHFQ